MGIKSQKDFFSGLMFVVVGVAFAWGATSYKVGDGARMGPGYFPLMLGVLLAILGGIVTFKSLVIETENGDKIGSFAWRPLVFIILANLAFGVLLGGLPSIKLPAMGLIAAIFALVYLSRLADGKFFARETTILAVVLAVGSYATFILLLKLQLPLWPTFITG